MKHVVAKVADIPPGERLIVEVAGRSVGIFNLDGHFYALRNQCPHAGAPVCQGVRGGLVTSSGPGSYQCSRAGEILRCPWHDWEFDIRTGKSVVDPMHLKIFSYRTEVVEGGAEGEGINAPAPTGIDASGKPFELETFPVFVESRYVIVDI